MDVIKFIWKIITNAPQIIALVKQLLELIGILTGDAGADETVPVSKAKKAAAELGECSGLGCPPQLLRDR